MENLDSIQYAMTSIWGRVQEIKKFGFDMPLTEVAFAEKEPYDKIVEAFNADKSVLRGLINDLERLL